MVRSVYAVYAISIRPERLSGVHVDQRYKRDYKIAKIIIEIVLRVKKASVSSILDYM